MSVKRITFIIERLPEGGFIVAPLINGGQNFPMFASLDLDDALNFIADQLEPIEEAQAVQSFVDIQQID